MNSFMHVFPIMLSMSMSMSMQGGHNPECLSLKAQETHISHEFEAKIVTMETHWVLTCTFPQEARKGGSRKTILHCCKHVG